MSQIQNGQPRAPVIAYCVTFLPRPPLGQRNAGLTDAGQSLIKLSTGMKLFGSENCSGSEFQELIIIKS
jgi:hypothetical protein